MSKPYSFTRYLEAKKTVDDRSLNTHVWNQLWEALPSSSRLAPLQILEVGAGTGTMIERILESNRLNAALYTAVDADAANINALRGKLQGWAEERPYFMVIPETADVLAFTAQEQDKEPYDLLIAHAFLDLLDLAKVLPALFARLKPGGLFYFTINFDGATIFEPASSFGRGFDDQIIDLYHGTMHNSHTGRQMFQQVQQAGGSVLAAGSSDWVVFAQDGHYPADEAYFLHHILHFFEGSLHNHPQLDPQQLTAWLAERHAQIERGELVYIAHQLDMLGRVGPSPKTADPAAERAANFRAAMQQKLSDSNT